MHTVTVRLDAAPRVANVGLGVHGTTGRHDVFLLPDLWQLHLYRYSAELTVAGTTHSIRPGYVSLIPPGTQVHYHYRGRSEHLYAHLRLAETGEPRTLPLMQDGGTAVPMLSNLLLQAITAMPNAPARTTAEVWATLWRIAELTPPSAPGDGHPAVATAIAYIEAHLAGPLAVPAVARAAGISHNHLTRLFHAENGDTVVTHIRRRRLARARHLLCESTLSIPAIAAAVGISDLQAFNKACHRELGASPRAVRAGTPPTPVNGTAAH